MYRLLLYLRYKGALIQYGVNQCYIMFNLKG